MICGADIENAGVKPGIEGFLLRLSIMKQERILLISSSAGGVL